MQYFERIRDWWLGQYRSRGRRGKLIWLGAPLLFACCGLTYLSSLISPPPDPTPTAEVAEVADRSATVEVVDIEPTDEPAAAVEQTSTDESAATNTPESTEAAEPTNTRPPRPTEIATDEPTDEPTRPPVRAATAVVATVAAAQPTAAASTATNIPAPTAALPTSPPATAAPTQAPQPTATTPPVAAPGDVLIASIRYDGDVPQVESDEYAVITNRGAAVVNLNGWRLNAGEPDQNFYFPSFDLQPGQSCRVYTNESHPDTCGFSFGRGDAIWRNRGDCGYLYDASGAEVSRYCW